MDLTPFRLPEFARVGVSARCQGGEARELSWRRLVERNTIMGDKGHQQRIGTPEIAHINRLHVERANQLICQFDNIDPFTPEHTNVQVRHPWLAPRRGTEQDDQPNVESLRNPFSGFPQVIEARNRFKIAGVHLLNLKWNHQYQPNSRCGLTRYPATRHTAPNLPA